MGLAEDFSAWVDKVRPDLFERARRLSNDPSLADDAVQHALTDAWRRHESLGREGMTFETFQAFLFTAARRYVYLAWRERNRHESLLRARASRLTETALLGRQKDIWPLVQRLPDDARDVIVWYFYDDVGYAEVGRRLDPRLALTSAQTKFGKRRVDESLGLLRRLAFIEEPDVDGWV